MSSKKEEMTGDGLNPHPVDRPEAKKQEDELMEQVLPDSAAKIQEEQEARPEIKPCSVCGGSAFIKCPTCILREKGEGKVPALAEGEQCEACEGEGVIPCPICFQRSLAQMPKPKVIIEFLDLMSAQFTVRMEGFHPALVTAQIMLVAEFLKVRAQWDQQQRFDAELQKQKGRQKMVAGLQKGVPLGGLPGGLIRAR